MQRRLVQNFTFILEWGQGTCSLMKHTRCWAYSRYLFPACCLLRFAAFLFYYGHIFLPKIQSKISNLLIHLLSSRQDLNIFSIAKFKVTLIQGHFKTNYLLLLTSRSSCWAWHYSAHACLCINLWLSSTLSELLIISLGEKSPKLYL